MYIKTIKNNKYEIDDSSCICGSKEVVYHITEEIRQFGVRIDALQEMILNTELNSCECPDCNAQFKFTKKEAG